MSNPIGTIEVLHGTASAASGDCVRELHQGSPVFEDDTVSTHADSALEIRFTDNTILAQGEHATLTLDEYLYEPEASQAELLFKLGAGTFRSITGDIVHENPDGFHLETPMSTIGIRGTSTAVTIPQPGSEDPTEQHMLMVFDGKVVTVEYAGDDTFRVMDHSGQKVAASSMGMGEVKIMTQAEFEFYQQLSPDNIQEGAPEFDSPQAIIAHNPGAARPVRAETLREAAHEDAEATGQEGADTAEENAADANQGDGAEDAPLQGGENAEEGEGEGTGEDNAETGDAVGMGLGLQALDGGAGQDILSGETGQIVTVLLAGGMQLTATLSEGAWQSLANASAGTSEDDAQSDTDLDPAIAEDGDSDSGPSSVTISGNTDLSSLDASVTSVTVSGTEATLYTSGTSVAGGNTLTVDASNLTGILGFSCSTVTTGAFSLTSGSGDDTLKGSDSQTTGDLIKGGTGSDTIYGYDGNDTLHGGAGDDTIYGDDGCNTSATGTDDDTIFGGAGTDAIYGDGGNDTIIGGNDNDTLDGGNGTDTLDYSKEAGTLAINGTVNGTITDTFGTTDTTTNFEAIIGTTHADTITANGQTVTGWAGNDTLFGEGNANAILSYLPENGGSGVTVDLANGTATDTFGDTDTLSGFKNVKGSGGADTISDSSDANQIWGEGGDDTININHATHNTVDGGEGDDTVTSSVMLWSGTYDGGTGSDTLVLSAESNSLDLTSSSLSISNFETVKLLGDSTGQSLTGLDATGTTNILYGAGGADTLTGSSSSDSDLFYYAASGEGKDTISGFQSGTDKLSFLAEGFTNLGESNWTFETSACSTYAGSATEAVFFLDTSDASHLTLYYDADGSGSGTAEAIADLGTTSIDSGDIQVVTSALC